MKPIFYTKIPKIYSIILEILFTIICTITLGIGLNIFYDFFLEHKYWLNRRILYRYLKSENLKYIKDNIGFGLKEYDFDNFKIWIYERKLKLALHNKCDNDIIGLFTSSKNEDMMVIKLIRKLNQLK